MTLELLLVAPSAEALGALSHQLPVVDDALEVVTRSGGIAELVSEIERGRPALIAAEWAAPTDDGLRRLEKALLASPTSAMILLTPDGSPGLLMRAMRAGVREVVTTPVTGNDLRHAFERQLARVLAQSGADVRRGRVLAFLPAKGGSGSTFLAANVAYALAARGQRVAVLDLNLQFGDIALFLSEARAPRTIADLAREVARIDATFLESSMLKAAPGLWVLPAPETPESAVDVVPEAVHRIIALARGRFDFVILDMGRTLDAATLRALDEADAIYITLQLTLPFIHDTRRLMALMGSLGFGRDKLHLIVNRHEKGAEIRVADAEQSLGMTMESLVPNSFDAVAYSINHGIALLRSAPRDPVARAIVAIADRLSPPPPEPARRWFGWLGARTQPQ